MKAFTSINKNRFLQALRKTSLQFANMMPILIGVVFLVGLMNTLVSEDLLRSVFSGYSALDTFLGALFGSFFTGNAINSYIIGGELREYGISLFVWMPEKAAAGLSNSLGIATRVVIPLFFVFHLMIALNIFLRPDHITKLLGKKMGLRAILFTVTAGIMCMGPIYIWYPMLTELQRKGTGNFLLAVFLNSRNIKPFLLPVMVSYFGWQFVAIFTAFMILSSLPVGYTVQALVKEG